jgi:hypothetical protein
MQAPNGTEVQQSTDDQGQTSFSLAEGQYVVYVPTNVQTEPPLPSDLLVVALPDGSLAHDWATVDITAGQTTNIDLRLTRLLP